MLNKTALGAIWIYQRYISPYKGFRCAYAVHHGGPGCSGFARRAIQEHGAWHAIPFIRQRLRDCKTAYGELRANCTCRSERTDEEPLSESERAELERRRREDKRRGKNNRGCDCGTGCVPMPMGCGSWGGGSTAASRGCDINPCDGDIGFGGCDCASCDCGGCSCGG
ncbi:MAG: membrane protein insertion efficiency factor YidD [Pseudomonadota bacterium]